MKRSQEEEEEEHRLFCFLLDLFVQHGELYLGLLYPVATFCLFVSSLFCCCFFFLLLTLFVFLLYILFIYPAYTFFPSQPLAAFVRPAFGYPLCHGCSSVHCKILKCITISQYRILMMAKRAHTRYTPRSCLMLKFAQFWFLYFVQNFCSNL